MFASPLNWGNSANHRYPGFPHPWPGSVTRGYDSKVPSGRVTREIGGHRASVSRLVDHLVGWQVPAYNEARKENGKTST